MSIPPETKVDTLLPYPLFRFRPMPMHVLVLSEANLKFQITGQSGAKVLLYINFFDDLIGRFYTVYNEYVKVE